jgi:hypothetical protein
MHFLYFAKQSVLARLLLLLLLLASGATRAQTWQQSLAGHLNQPAGSASSYGVHTATDAQGNVFVTGQFQGSITVGNIRLGDVSGIYLFVGKWSPTAKTWLWATTSTGINGAGGNAIAVSNGNVYVTGTFYATTGIAGQTLTAAKAGTSSNTDMFLAKYVDNGSSFSNGWAVRSGGTGSDGGSGLAVVGNTVYVTGSFSGAATIADQPKTAVNGYADMFLAKYIDNGSSATGGWVVTGGGPTDDVGTRVVATAAGTVYATGTFTGTATLGGRALTSAGGTDTYLLKGTDQGATYANGWVVRGGGTGAETSADLALVGSALYTTGSFASTTTLAGTTLTSKGSTDLYVAKYVDRGNTCANGWALAEGGTGTDGATTLAVSGATFYVGGSFQGTATIGGRSLRASGVNTDTDALVASYTDQGSRATPLWAAGYGGNSSDGAWGLVLDSGGALHGLVDVSSDGGVFGTTPPTLTASNSLALLGFDPATGAVQSVDAPYQGGGSIVRATARNAAGDVYLAGEFNGAVGFGHIQLVARGDLDMFVAKWSAATGTWAWATAAGGTRSTTQALGIALSGTNIYLTGGFTNTVTIAGQALTVGSGYSADVFVAKYVDQGTSAANGWATGGGGYYADNGNGIVASGSSIYVTGSFTGRMTLAGQSVTSNNFSSDMFLAKLTDGGISPTGVWMAVDGGTSTDHGYGLALSGTSLYVAGDYYAGAGAVIAGQPLAQAGPATANGFLAKYVDQGSTYANGWATSLGGTADADGCRGVAVVGNALYVAGYYAVSASVAGQTLTSAGDRDAFIAKYVDEGGTAAGAWAASGGGSGYDMATAVASDGTSVYLAGYYGASGATFAGQALNSAGFYDLFVAKYTDQGSTGANGWAVGAGGTSTDYAYSLALTTGGVYVAGSLRPTATVGPTTFLSPNGNDLNFLGQISNDTAAPLPVQLVNFTASAAGPAAVRLTWITASEVNSARFEVERSLDGVAFNQLGQVVAAGNSISAHTYDLTDTTLPSSGVLYYRLRQVDLDGTATYSPVRTVAVARAGLALFPNPTATGATLTGAALSTVVHVLDALGRVVFTTKTDATGTAILTLPTTLPSGVYLVRAGQQAVRLTVE